MIIFVGNIPEFANVSELKKFFKGYDKLATFEIKHLVDKDGNANPYAIISIPSERLAAKAIKRLHMKKFMGRSIIVREYEHRASGNDRRQLGWRKKLWLGQERRQTDRREPRDESDKTSGHRAA